MTEKRQMRVPPKFSELKKQADEINNPIDKLNFWIDQKRQYVQESSWKMREVTVFDDTDVYKTDALKRRSAKFKQTGRDHNLISIEAEIESLKALHEYNQIEIEPKRKQPKPNQFRKRLEKLAQENEAERNQFVSDAKEFLIKKMKAGKPRSDFITDKGWPTVKFFRDPFRSSDIPESTRKDWLKRAISKDEV